MIDQKLIGKKYIVHGRVQGVFFRKYTYEIAQSIGLKGFVKNLPDGTVLIEAEGTIEQLNQLKKWCNTGSPLSSVIKVECSDAQIKNYSVFEIH